MDKSQSQKQKSVSNIGQQLPVASPLSYKTDHLCDILEDTCRSCFYLLNPSMPAKALMPVTDALLVTVEPFLKYVLGEGRGR